MKQSLFMGTMGAAIATISILSLSHFYAIPAKVAILDKLVAVCNTKGYPGISMRVGPETMVICYKEVAGNDSEEIKGIGTPKQRKLRK